MFNFKPQKGKAYENLPTKEVDKFDKNQYLVSTKYDGNQIFIVKKDKAVRYFTSDWKEFNIPHLSDQLLSNESDFILIGEFMYGCEGKLGDRGKSAVITTWRTNFVKGKENMYDPAKVNIRVFDCLLFDNNGLFCDNYKAEYRLVIASLLSLPENIKVVSRFLMSGAEAKVKAKRLVAQGWEGVMCIDPHSAYSFNKRVNYAVKLKYRKTADLLCIDYIDGEGKYHNMIGSLILKDKAGRIVAVGSGLDDASRQKDISCYLNKVIEIEYEQIIDTYIQPTFIQVREDKQAKDID